MFRNYLTIALRHLIRHKLYSFINILGLAVGIASCLVTFLYIRFEWSYDGFHQNADRIYLIYHAEGIAHDWREKIWVATPFPLAPALSETFPEVRNAVRLDYHQIKEGVPVRYENKLFNQAGLYADPSFFEMFSFPRVAGDLKTALQDVNSVVITREMAHKYFGNENSLDKQISIRTGRKVEDFIVTGVVEIPENSSIRFDFLLSFEKKIQNGTATVWSSWNYLTFVELSDQEQAIDFEKKLLSFGEKYIDEIKQSRGKDFELQLKALPLTDIHLHPGINYQLAPTTDPAYSYILSGIALAILLIACVNFMNLSLGLSSTRFKETGMRKVFGTTRQQLIKQFCGESILLSFLALIIGISLTELTLPTFNGLVHKNLSVDYSAIWRFLLSLMLLVGFVAGSYPALVLSGFHPVELLKGRLKVGNSNRFSQGLVVIQFTLSIVMIIAALMMSNQMDFLKTRNLGFDAEQIVVINTGRYDFGLAREEKKRLLEAYRQAAAQQSSILSVSAATASPGLEGLSGSLATYEGLQFYRYTITTDFDYLKTLGIELVEGRDFSEGFGADARESIIINEAMVKILGWDSAVGKIIPFLKGQFQGNDKAIVGVTKDFHIRSLHHPIGPMFITLNPNAPWLQYIFVRISPHNVPAAISLLKEKWQQICPDRVFTYSFLDEDIDRQYRIEKLWNQIVHYAAALAIFIACLGAFGLVSLAVSRRTREIGIRKVLGASFFSIASLLSREFIKLVVIANLIAWPVAYYAMHRWLQNFAYRIEMTPGIFLLGGALILVIVVLTVSFQTVKAARANPVDALRSE